MDQVFQYYQGAYDSVNSSGGGGGSMFWWIIGAIGLWKMFEMAGEPGWIGLIPFYREYKLCEKVMNNPWYWVRTLVSLLIPFVGIFLFIYFRYQIGKATAKAYGKPDLWAWGYAILDPIFYCLTGLGNSSYYGPYGSGDTRTGEARQARTVDFDVVKNEPEREDEAEIRINQTGEVRMNSAEGVRINEADDFTMNNAQDVEAEIVEDEVEFTFE